jgi:hypothetical protein
MTPVTRFVTSAPTTPPKIPSNNPIATSLSELSVMLTRDAIASAQALLFELRHKSLDTAVTLNDAGDQVRHFRADHSTQQSIE